MATALFALSLAAAAPHDPAPAPAARGLPRIHAHNDYQHRHPLFDALHQGFTGVEADIYLVGSDLRVSHAPAKDWSAVPTLEASYLTPLADLVRAHPATGVYAGGPRVMLLIDVKTDAAATYRRLDEVLAGYQASNPRLFTSYTKTENGYTIDRGAIDVVVSGNRGRDVMAKQAVRYAAYDGRQSDIGPDVNPDDGPSFVPLISDSWTTLFATAPKWDGTGPMPPELRARLEQIVKAVHAEGKQFRPWNLPKDTADVWGPLYDAGVDWINTDDLEGLAKFMKGMQ